MELTAGFPAKEGMGFWRGYSKRFTRVFTLFYITFVVLFLTVFIWTVASIPLAIINELSLRGSIRAAVYYAALAVTALVAYSWTLFIRVYLMSFIPSFYSGSSRPLADSFSFSGRYFFGAAKFFVVADVLLFFFISLYSFMERALVMLVLNCAVTASLVFFLFFILYDMFAANGYGYDEYDDSDAYRAYDAAEAGDEAD